MVGYQPGIYQVMQLCVHIVGIRVRGAGLLILNGNTLPNSHEEWKW